MNEILKFAEVCWATVSLRKARVEFFIHVWTLELLKAKRIIKQ